MKIEPTSLKDLYVIKPSVIQDSRGFFMEVFRDDLYAEQGLAIPRIVQQNHSKSSQGVVRGLHFQWDKPLGKLIRVVSGSAFVVAVDIRKKSETLGKWFGLEVSAENKNILYAPAGFASGFAVTSLVAEVEYLYTAIYNQQGESNILWNDPKIGINWPIPKPLLSDRDKSAVTLAEWLQTPESDLV
jgi:dTDP-4-dehydrorhamnose 3,5-epimerase